MLNQIPKITEHNLFSILKNLGAHKGSDVYNYKVALLNEGKSCEFLEEFSKRLYRATNNPNLYNQSWVINQLTIFIREKILEEQIIKLINFEFSFFDKSFNHDDYYELLEKCLIIGKKEILDLKVTNINDYSVFESQEMLNIISDFI